MISPAFLALDASSEACSAALLIEHETPKILLKHSLSPRQHSCLLQTYVSELLINLKTASVSLQAVLIGQGPGSFAGVRIAAAIAQGIASVHALPLVGVSSMQAMAWSFYKKSGRSNGQMLKAPDRIIVVNDAKMGEFYVGMYRVQEDRLIVERDEQLVSHTGVSLLIDSWSNEEKLRPDSITIISQEPSLLQVLFATDLPITSNIHNSLQLQSVLPDAEAVLHLGRLAFNAGLGDKPEHFQPKYLRAATAWEC